MILIKITRLEYYKRNIFLKYVKIYLRADKALKRVKYKSFVKRKTLVVKTGVIFVYP